jgi:hypothetical protein
MKAVLFTMILAAGPLAAQTTIIAHKSHSGTASTFTFADPGNFGAPSPSIIAITRLNDTTSLIRYDRWGGNREDTIYNHPLYTDPNIPEDTMKVMMEQMGIEYSVQPEESTDPVSKKSAPQPEKKSQKSKTKKEDGKKEGSLLWIVILGGGTFFGGMIAAARRSRMKPGPSVIC